MWLNMDQYSWISLNILENAWIWHVCICKGYTEFWVCLSVTQYASIIPENASISLKVGFSLSKKIYFIWFNKSPLNMMKKPFHFNLKVLFVLEIFRFLSWLFVEKMLDQKDKVNFKIYGVTTWLTITIHILPNISRSKGNQAMKFDQLIKCIKRNIFRQKLCGKWDRETSSRPLFIF